MGQILWLHVAQKPARFRRAPLHKKNEGRARAAPIVRRYGVPAWEATATAQAAAENSNPPLAGL